MKTAISFFEQNGGTYTRVGDVLLPDLTLEETDSKPLGKYGRMRKRYLKEQRPALNRNKMINDAMILYIKLIKTLGKMELLNDITYNQDGLRRFLFKQCKDIQREWKRIY